MYKQRTSERVWRGRLINVLTKKNTKTKAKNKAEQNEKTRERPTYLERDS